MQENYIDFLNSLKNKKVMFCGIGRSNLPLIDVFTKNGINVIAYDSKPQEKFDAKIIEKLENNPLAKLRFADESVWDDNIDVIIRTPGMNFFSEKITKAREKGIIVTSEMEIFFDYCPCPIIGITGSDGKTTTSTLIHEILKADGKTVHLGGNIGEPLLPKIESISKNDIAVVELSSFQLISMRQSPETAIITNISPNHLDVHKDMNEYIDAKKQILLHQNAFSKTILNFNNEITKNMIGLVRGKAIFFSRTDNLQNMPCSVWVDDNKNIIYTCNKNTNQKNEVIINTADIKIPGNHNIENYLTAIAAVHDMVSPESIKKVATSFPGVKHRIEFVREVGGVSYYNDSIASSPNRTISGTLSLFDKKIILIAGGYDKKIPFDTLAPKIAEKVSTLILLGQTSEKILNEIEKLPKSKTENLNIIKTTSMQEAVEKAKEVSKQGDIVVLSPACASFDLYKDFEARGDHFKELVNLLP